MTPQHVSYRSLETAPAVLLAGFEPEEESPIVFLRLRKGVRKHGTKVVTVAPFRSQGAGKLSAMLLQALPGTEADVLAALDTEVTSALEQDGSVILVGERLATSPGALAAAVDLARRTGAKLAWVPRRAGEVGAIAAGALPLPAFGVEGAGRNAEQILRGVITPEHENENEEPPQAELGALLVGGIDPADFADPAQAYAAIAAAGFVVSLEVRRSAVTEHADVVLPVAPPAEKAGRFVTWEGRRRPFDLTITGTGALTDGQVLDALADELDVVLGLRTVGQARDELAEFAFGGQSSDTKTARQEPAGGGGATGAVRHLARAARRRPRPGRRRLPRRDGQTGARADVRSDCGRARPLGRRPDHDQHCGRLAHAADRARRPARPRGVGTHQRAGGSGALYAASGQRDARRAQRG